MRIYAILLFLALPLACERRTWAFQEQSGQVSTPIIDQRLPPDRLELDKVFAAELDALAAKCDELKMPAEAQTTRQWQIPRRYQVQYHFLPDFNARDIREKKIPGPPSASASDAQKSWWKRFMQIRAAQADRLFDLAKKRLTNDRLQEAFALLHEVLRENSDHPEARRILGYTGKPGAWLPQERQPRYSKSTQVETGFNWAPNRHGVVDSAHFRIRTNSEPLAAVAAATFLEECHDVWSAVFSGFWLDPAELKSRFDGAAPKPASKRKEKLEVILFVSREEYISQLEPYEKNIAASRGYFAPGRKTSFFYLDESDPQVRANWAHEISHQLFSAYSRNPPGLTKNANFWVIEGAAMYMESLSRREGYWTTGGFEAQRLQDARHRQRNLQEHASLRELLPLGQEPFQRDPRIRQLYTAGAGYTHYFLDGEEGKYRDGFLRYLRQIYDEQDTADLLEKELNITADSIDKSYAAFLDVYDMDLQTLDNLALNRLILGRTSVTSKGLQSLKSQSALKELDLTDLAIADDSLLFLSPTCDLEELSLFGVEVTSACGNRLARMQSLRDLNLSRTKIDDAICKALSSLPKLETLSINDTKITDAAEAAIAKIKSLRELDASGSKITPEGAARIKKSNSSLNITL
jgi:hypothetical protein